MSIAARCSRDAARRCLSSVILLVACIATQALAFGDDGVAIPPIYIPGGDTTTAAVLRQSDGKLVVAGTAEGPIGTTMFAARFTSGGALDPSFGTAGIAYLPLSPGLGLIQAVGATLDAQGNVVLVGSLLTTRVSSFSMAVARLTASGLPDTTFGPDSLREITLPGYDELYSTRVALDAAGNIVIAGLARSYSTGFSRMAVVRVLPAGVLDTSFNGTGYSILNLFPYTDAPSGLAIDASGNIIVAGKEDPSSVTPFAIVKLTSTGQIDLSFNGTGIVRLSHGYAIALDSSDKVVVAASGGASSFGEAVYVARLTTGGAPDPSFAGGGWQEFDFGNQLATVATHQVTVDHSGRIVVALTGYASQGFALATTRFAQDGTVDTTFNGSGLRLVPANWVAQHREAALAIDPADNIVIAGTHYDLSSPLQVSDGLVARITPSGSLDPSFNGTGSVVQNCGVRQLTTTSMVRQSDGKIVLAGYMGSFFSNAHSIVARLTTLGDLDPGFNGTGFREIDISPSGGDALNAIAIDSVGRIVVAGRDANGNFAVARLTGNGAMDSSFNGIGIAIIGGARAGNIGVNAVAIDASDNILIIGPAPFQSGGGFELGRLTPSGAVDGAFGSAGTVFVTINNQFFGGRGAQLALDSVGRVVFGGTAQYAQNNPSWVVGRLTSSGALDSGFGSGGLVTLTSLNYENVLVALVIDGSDRILLAGMDGVATVRRLTLAGQLDPSFNGTGTLYYTDFSPTIGPLALAIDNAGKILVGANAPAPYPDDRSKMVALRVLSNGTVDTTFNAGQAAFSLASEADVDDTLAAVASDSAGGIYLGGTTGRSMAVVKLFDGTPTTLGVAIDTLALRYVFVPFDVVVEARDDNGNSQPVSSATTIELSLGSGTGVLSGTLSCVIPAGSTACRLNVTYSAVEGIVLTATATTGDALGTVSSPLFGVNQDRSTTTLAVDINPSIFGQTVTFTVTVNAVNPTGTIMMSDEYGFVPGCGILVLTGGGSTKTVTCTTSGLVVGTHHISAQYSGDTFTFGSNGAGVMVVNSVPGVNVALASAGAFASASTTFSVLYPTLAINNGDRAGLNFGNLGVWKDATPGVFPDWVEIDFNGPQTIDRVIVYSVQDNNLNPVDPSDTLTFTQFGLTAFDVQTWDGSAWAWVTQGSVAGNNLVKRTVSFNPTTTSKIRVLINGAAGGTKRSGPYSYIAEVEAWTPAAAPPPGTTLASSANPGKVGQGITVTASVNGSSPTGTVGFSSDGATIKGCAAQPLMGAGNVRTATCTTSFKTVGTYTIVGSYSGGGGNPPSASGPLAEVIKKKGH